MAVATLAYTTAGTTLNKNYRKIQGKMMKVFQSDCEEWDLIDDLPEQDITISAREMTVPIDVKLQGGTASIPEAGHEAMPWTVALNEVTLTWVNLNQRWTTSLTAKYLDRKAAEGMVFRQLKYQAMKAMEGLSNRVGQMFYGFSNGTVCESTTNATATTQSLTLADAYGDSAIDTASYLASFFVVGDQIALHRSGTLVTNAVGEITAVNASTGVLTVVFAGSVDADANDVIVFANGAINSASSTIAAGTDYNRWPVGLKDMAESTSVHSLASSSEANWDAALVDTNGGSYSFLKERKARQALHNLGKAKAEVCVWSNGVENDVIVNERGAVMFSDALNMTFDGSIKTKGLTRFTSRKVPPGHVFLFDRDAIGKFSLVPKPSEAAPAWSDGDKAEDMNALKFSVDFPFAFVCRKRRGIVEYRGLSEQ